MQACWALANLVGGDVALRDAALEEPGLVEAVAAALRDDVPDEGECPHDQDQDQGQGQTPGAGGARPAVVAGVERRWLASWLACNLCRGEPPPPFAATRPLLEDLAGLLGRHGEAMANLHDDDNAFGAGGDAFGDGGDGEGGDGDCGARAAAAAAAQWPDEAQAAEEACWALHFMALAAGAAGEGAVGAAGADGSEGGGGGGDADAGPPPLRSGAVGELLASGAAEHLFAILSFDNRWGFPGDPSEPAIANPDGANLDGADPEGLEHGAAAQACHSGPLRLAALQVCCTLAACCDAGQAMDLAEQGAFFAAADLLRSVLQAPRDGDGDGDFGDDGDNDEEGEEGGAALPARCSAAVAGATPAMREEAARFSCELVRRLVGLHPVHSLPWRQS